MIVIQQVWGLPKKAWYYSNLIQAPYWSKVIEFTTTNITVNHISYKPSPLVDKQAATLF